MAGEEISHIRGKLDVEVQEATGLPNLDTSSWRRPDDLSDPYVVVKIVGPKKTEKRMGKTPTIDDCLNPKWFHHLSTNIDQEVQEIRFDVKDDGYRSEKIGSCSVPVNMFSSGDGFQGSLELVTKRGEGVGKLKVKITLIRNSRDYKVPNPIKKRTLKGCIKKMSNKSAEVVDVITQSSFIHGKMIIAVISADNLPNLDMDLLNSNNKTDSTVIVSLVDGKCHSCKVATTRCINDELNPEWGEIFPVNVCHDVSSVLFQVYDQDFLTKEKIGTVSIPVSKFIDTESFSGKFDIINNRNKACGKLNLSIQLKKSNTLGYEVPDCPFPLRSKNKVKLYQDAHCPGLPNNIFSDSGGLYIPDCAWIDIQDAIINAENFILIVGWSVKSSVTLVRGEYGGGRTLGEILCHKALQGVDVRLLLWDEITSTDSNPAGIMSTFDNETKEYFKKSPVKVSLALRNKKQCNSRPDEVYVSKCCYTHHQKTIITDARSPCSNMGSHRCLVAFLGGLDLTIGRYDTPAHPLYSTLDNHHKKDFYNNVIRTSVQSGPRQPWHDIHCQIFGPSARDIYNNFTERWMKQGLQDDSPISCEDIDLNFEYEGEDSYDVQVFRSISEDSLSLSTVNPSNLMTKQGKKIDNSLHRAYVHQIQKAQKFIYIENQYFMGSSHVWEDCKDTGIKNLVPLEIVSKIVEKISQGESFVVYVVIPMHPEGNPADSAMQEILHWQFHTIEMMYQRIGAAIVEAGVSAHPQDYLLFLCLGKREGPESLPSSLKQPLDDGAALAFRNRRSMIYVHSKMAIFDDQYIIVGSANINDRSLAGSRDTEIAMGAYQPHEGSRGCVATFRKCLWSEHFGLDAPLYLDPGSQECARKVRSLAEDSLQRYIDISKPLPTGHLLLYPLRVEESGVVTSRSDCETFPDTKALVVGARSKLLPSVLTT